MHAERFADVARVAAAAKQGGGLHGTGAEENRFGLDPDCAMAHWGLAVDACRMLTSPAYHLLRKWHGLEALPYLGQELAYIRDDPNWVYV